MFNSHKDKTKLLQENEKLQENFKRLSKSYETLTATVESFETLANCSLRNWQREWIEISEKFQNLCAKKDLLEKSVKQMEERYNEKLAAAIAESRATGKLEGIEATNKEWMEFAPTFAEKTKQAANLITNVDSKTAS